MVLGGVHACLMPEECLQHADAIVIGEAEYVWPQVLRDVAAGRLQEDLPPGPPDGDGRRADPRRDLLRQDPLVGMIQATRGCHHSCKFCYLPSVPWHRHRRRDPRRVYEELAGMPQKVVFFVDDNLFTDEEYAIELCETIAPLKKAWSVQAPTTITKNRRLLEAMRRSGCFFVQVGFQTVHPDSLQNAGVAQNRIESYREVVRSFHQHGMLVQGFFIFGFDNEDTRIFETAEGHIRQMGLEDALLYILTPYPGTPIFEQLQREGRLLVHEREVRLGQRGVQAGPDVGGRAGEGRAGDVRTALPLLPKAGAPADPEMAAALRAPPGPAEARLGSAAQKGEHPGGAVSRPRRAA